MTAIPAGHRIRLRGPWKVARFDESGRMASTPQVFRLPEEWPLVVAAQAGRAELTRTFHSPSGLEETETLFVVLTGVRGVGEIWLNGRSLGTFNAERSIWEFPVPLPLPFTNELKIAVTFTAPTPQEPQVGLYDVVSLDIRAAQPASSS